MSDTRFNSTEYLDAWKATGKYPAIHDGIVRLFMAGVQQDVGRVLDLGSSTGLLTHRLRHYGYDVVGVESSRAAVTAGREAGTYKRDHDLPGSEPEVYRHQLLPGELHDFGVWLLEHQIKAVVARRVLPELDDYGVTPAMMSDVLVHAGIEHLFLEGRAPRKHATHRLPTLAQEIDALGDAWTPKAFDGPHRAHLIRTIRRS
ncbi:class I SAM-dependent methyltransferase [Mycobacteroides abscessus]|uniref:class I SAM-dependent methyltransferase n=1 Tax=Mycobacteroides abscessus TaxID=36809 RepID=UPI0009A6601F|nr:class I SAM-dependent methyltransferase [Mycobacteroides abscessus]SKT22812.1 Uncharacterised protein [Mycobacteroides abscessus subsp. bolletii]SLF56149.1 Uncharacterised protein [Mycobacteroides abscessus subsp. bolletii]